MDKLIDGFKQLGQMFGKIGKLFDAITEVGKGMGEIGQGVVQEVEGVPFGAWYAAMDLVVFIQYLWEFFITNFICGMKSMKNLRDCMFWYILDIIGKIIYLVPTMFFIGLNLLYDGVGTKIEKKIWNFLAFIDLCTISWFKVHIIHFPKSIREKCYSCRYLKPDVFIKQAVIIVEDLADPILPDMFGGIMTMFHGFGRIVGALQF